MLDADWGFADAPPQSGQHYVMCEKDSNNLFKRANVFLATFHFIFLFSKYQRIAANHDIAINLEAPDLKRNFENGTYNPDVRDAMISSVDSAKKLRLALLKSFFAVFLTLSVALSFTFYEGSVKPSLLLSWEKILGLTAAFLLMWSTLFELGWGLRTAKGQALHELIHSLIFRTIFIFGSFFLMLVLLIK